MVVANTHLTFRHGMLDAYLRKRQIARLLDKIDEHVKQYDRNEGEAMGLATHRPARPPIRPRPAPQSAPSPRPIPLLYFSAPSRLVLERVPVILAGDFNGDSADPVYRAIVGRGYHSSAKEARGREAGVTHLTHNGQSVGVDFIFFRSVPSLCERVHAHAHSKLTWPGGWRAIAQQRRGARLGGRCRQRTVQPGRRSTAGADAVRRPAVASD